MLSRNSFFKMRILLSFETLNHCSPSSPCGRAVYSADFPVVDWIGVGSNPAGDIYFTLNFSLPPRSEQVNGAVANEIKHIHSPEVIVVLDPRYDLSYKALYIHTCSIALTVMFSVCNNLALSSVWTLYKPLEKLTTQSKMNAHEESHDPAVQFNSPH